MKSIPEGQLEEVHLEWSEWQERWSLIVKINKNHLHPSNPWPNEDGQFSGHAGGPDRAPANSAVIVAVSFPFSACSWGRCGRGWWEAGGEDGQRGGAHRYGDGDVLLVSRHICAPESGTPFPVPGLWKELQMVIQIGPSSTQPQQREALPLQPLSQGLQGFICTALPPTVSPQATVCAVCISSYSFQSNTHTCSRLLFYVSPRLFVALVEVFLTEKKRSRRDANPHHSTHGWKLWTLFFLAQVQNCVEMEGVSRCQIRYFEELFILQIPFKCWELPDQAVSVRKPCFCLVCVMVTNLLTLKDIRDRTAQPQLYIFENSFTKMLWFWKSVLTSSTGQLCIGHTQSVVSQFLWAVEVRFGVIVIILMLLPQVPLWWEAL